MPGPSFPQNIENNSASENMCSYCRENLSCSLLKAKIADLEAEVQRSIDPISRSRYMTFKRKLKDYGFAFPEAQRLCWLHNKRTIVNGLIEEAASLLGEIRPCNKEVAVSYRRVSNRL